MAPAGVKPGDARRAAPFRRTTPGLSQLRAPRPQSAFLAPFQGPAEPKRFRPGLDNVCPIRDPVQQCFA
jgi:hypothetical protein